MNFSKRYAITFGEVAILHVGGKEIGNGIPWKRLKQNLIDG